MAGCTTTAITTTTTHISVESPDDGPVDGDTSQTGAGTPPLADDGPVMGPLPEPQVDNTTAPEQNPSATSDATMTNIT